MTTVITRITPGKLIGTLAASGIALTVASRCMTKEVRADSVASPVKVFGGGPVSLALEKSEVINDTTKRLRFKLPNEESVTGLPLTSAVLTVTWPKGSWLPIARPYTPVSSADEPGHMDLMVKGYPDGRVSGHLHSLQPGDKLFFATSFRGYPWKPNSHPHITLVGGGTGITPLYQLAQGILRNPEDKTALTLVYGATGDEDVLLKSEFEQFEKEFPGRFKAVYTVTSPSEGSPLRKGHVDKELLEEVVPSPVGRDTKVFVCGPPAMEKSLVGGKGQSGILNQIGYKKDQIHTF